MFEEYLLLINENIIHKHILITNHCHFFKIRKIIFLIGIKSSSFNLDILFVC